MSDIIENIMHHFVHNYYFLFKIQFLTLKIIYAFNLIKNFYY